MSNYGNHRNVQGYRRIGFDQWVYDGGRSDGDAVPADTLRLLNESSEGRCGHAFRVNTGHGTSYLFVPLEGVGWVNMNTGRRARTPANAAVNRFYGDVAEQYLAFESASFMQRPRRAAPEKEPVPLFTPDMS